MMLAQGENSHDNEIEYKVKNSEKLKSSNELNVDCIDNIKKGFR